MKFKSEHDLEKAAIPFLRQNNYLYCWQVPIANRVIDLAAMNADGDLIGVEFKLKAWKRAILQAKRNSNSFDYVYVCMDGGGYLDKLKKKAEVLGVGVMVYAENTIKVILEAKRVTRQWGPNVQHVKEYLKGRGER